MTTSKARLITLNSRNLSIASHYKQKLLSCWHCREKFTVNGGDIDIISKGAGRCHHWYHIECAKLVNLIE
jgi:hypothetical protein